MYISLNLYDRIPITDRSNYQALGTSGQVFLQLSVNAGMGQHLETLSDSSCVVTLKWSWVFQLLLIATSCFGKLAFVMFLIQIRDRHERKPWFLLGDGRHDFRGQRRRLWHHPGTM